MSYVYVKKIQGYVKMVSSNALLGRHIAFRLAGSVMARMTAMMVLMRHQIFVRHVFSLCVFYYFLIYMIYNVIHKII